jgi:hypothetical protein
MALANDGATDYAVDVIGRKAKGGKVASSTPMRNAAEAFRKAVTKSDQLVAKRRRAAWVAAKQSGIRERSDIFG